MTENTRKPGEPVSPAPPKAADAAPDPDKAEAQQGFYHFFCDQCGHTWWSNNLDTHCIWGCPTGRAVPM